MPPYCILYHILSKEFCFNLKSYLFLDCFLTFIWYNTYTPKESSLSTAFPVGYFGVVSIKAITVALTTSRERSSQLCSRRMRFSTSESLSERSG